MSKTAFEASSFKGFLVDPNALTIVGLDTDDGQEHALYDERIHLPIDEALVKNLMVHGNLVPVVVRKNGSSFEVIDGRQRTRCAREANKRLVKEGKEPLRVKVTTNSSEDDVAFGIMISTNELRRDDSPLAKARKVERYMAMGRTKAEAAVTFGCTQKTIDNYLDILHLADEVKEKIEAGKISAYAAAQLANLPAKEQIEKIAELEGSGGKLTGSRIKKAKDTGDVSDKKKAPGRAVLRKVLAHENAKSALSLEVRMALSWALGESDPSDVPGLDSLLADAGSNSSESDEDKDDGKPAKKAKSEKVGKAEKAEKATKKETPKASVKKSKR